MALDLTKPVRLKIGGPLRTVGGPVGDGRFVVLNSDGTYAAMAPLTLEALEAEYENAAEERPEAPAGPTAALSIRTAIGKCCSGELSRYALDSVLVVPGESRPWLAATTGQMLAIVPVDGEASHRQLMPGHLADSHAGVERVTRQGDEWRNDRGRWAPRKSGKFPDVTGAVKDIKPNFAVSLNARFVLSLAQALHSRNDEGEITLLLDRDDSSAYIGVLTSEGFGVLAPIGGLDAKDQFSEKWPKYQEYVERFTRDYHSAPIEPETTP